MTDEGGRIAVAAFYQFVSLPDYVTLRQELLPFGPQLSLCGTILVAPEGINGTIAGPPDSLKEFIASLKNKPEFTALEVKWSHCSSPPFRRWRVRLKKEIVTLKAPQVNPLEAKGIDVDPEDWNEVVADPTYQLIDVRNDFEVGYGTFKQAINPHTSDFSEFPAFVQSQGWDPDQPIAMFCTGGIRCEKASSYLVQAGFKNVKQLRGGILKYLEVTSPEETLWEGSCFVFDDRIALDHNLDPIS